MVAGKLWLVVMRSNRSLPDDLILREFQLSTDYTQVVTLWQNAGPGIHVRRSDSNEEITKKLHRDPDLCLVAELGGLIIGTVIYHLAVDVSSRNKGIGTALMAELESRMKQKGCIRTYLLVTRDNLDAIRFYESQKWEQMDLLIYGKDLG